MGDLASEHDSAISLVVEEYRRLQGHDPNHPLLRYVCEVSDNGFRYSPDEQTRQEFVDAYAPGNEPIAVMLAKYFVALRDAVDGIEGIDRSPKPKEPPVPVMALDDIDDEPLPF